eukprot:gene1740-3359_t
MTALRQGTKLSNRWVLGKKLGEGACAEVFEVYQADSSNKESLVIKCIPLPTGKGKVAQNQTKIANTLFYEHTLYRGVLLGYKYSPKLPSTAYGEDLGYRYLVMERFDMDLKDLAKSGNLLTPGIVASIGLQLLEALKSLHDKGHIFVDVKPDNFMISKTSSNSKGYCEGDRIVLVDFGLVEKYTQYNGGGHKEQTTRQKVGGTPAFVSISVHQCSTPSRRDDMEALGYVLLSLRMGGVLPWSTATSDNQCRTMKMECDITALAVDLGCPEVGEIVLASRSLQYEACPDYDQYAKLLRAMQTRKDTTTATSTTTGKGRSGAVGKSLPVQPSPSSSSSSTTTSVPVSASVSSNAKVKVNRSKSKGQQRPQTEAVDDMEVVEEMEMDLEKIHKEMEGKDRVSNSNSNSSRTKRKAVPNKAVAEPTPVVSVSASKTKTVMMDQKTLRTQETLTGNGIGGRSGGRSKPVNSEIVVMDLMEEDIDNHIDIDIDINKDGDPLCVDPLSLPLPDPLPLSAPFSSPDGSERGSPTPPRKRNIPSPRPTATAATAAAPDSSRNKSPVPLRTGMGVGTGGPFGGDPSSGERDKDRVSSLRSSHSHSHTIAESRSPLMPDQSKVKNNNNVNDYDNIRHLRHATPSPLLKNNDNNNDHDVFLTVVSGTHSGLTFNLTATATSTGPPSVFRVGRDAENCEFLLSEDGFVSDRCRGYEVHRCLRRRLHQRLYSQRKETPQEQMDPSQGRRCAQTGGKHHENRNEDDEEDKVRDRDRDSSGDRDNGSRSPGQEGQRTEQRRERED